jgi:hypothetical protein
LKSAGEKTIANISDFFLRQIMAIYRQNVQLFILILDHSGVIVVERAEVL